MENLYVMQGFESSNNLNKYFPNLIFMYILLLFLMIRYFLKQIAIIWELHYYAVIVRQLKWMYLP